MRFVSDIKKNHSFLVWLGITVFCIVFSAIYEYFSFGVFSAAMVLIFLPPFLFGMIPSLITGRDMGRLWNDGVLCLIVGSMCTGIFDIYGTTSVWPQYIMIVGCILMILQLFFRWMSGLENPKPVC